MDRMPCFIRNTTRVVATIAACLGASLGKARVGLAQTGIRDEPGGVCWRAGSPAQCTGFLVTEFRALYYFTPSTGLGAASDLGYMRSVGSKHSLGAALHFAYNQPSEVWAGLVGRYRYWPAPTQSVEFYLGTPVAGEPRSSEIFAGAKYNPTPSLGVLTEVQFLESGTAWAVGVEVGGPGGLIASLVAAAAVTVLGIVGLAGQS